MTAAVIRGQPAIWAGPLSGAFLADGYRVYGADIASMVEPRAGLVPCVST